MITDARDDGLLRFADIDNHRAARSSAYTYFFSPSDARAMHNDICNLIPRHTSAIRVPPPIEWLQRTINERPVSVIP